MQPLRDRSQVGEDLPVALWPAHLVSLLSADWSTRRPIQCPSAAIACGPSPSSHLMSVCICVATPSSGPVTGFLLISLALEVFQAWPRLPCQLPDPICSVLWCPCLPGVCILPSCRTPAPWSPGLSFLPLCRPGSSALSHLHGASLFPRELSQLPVSLHPRALLAARPSMGQGRSLVQ